MTGIVLGLIVMGFVPLTFFICDGSEYSCQVVRAASVLFGLMALAMTSVLAVGVWRDKYEAKNSDRPERQ